IESSLISQIFGNPTRVSGADVTRERLETELKKPYNIFHFNGHGNYNFRNPSQSALALSADEKLTLKEIVQMPFSGYQIISLSACETAVTGNQNITSEYVGLVSGFLRQGASYVLSTLWTVNEIPAALFVIRFYQLFAAGATPPVALKHAKHWLRNLTYP
ncbi:CHAT domain-containing protein, partial [Klebsiella pneumoniae]|uniref:CHAT domain-containing protein n=1 Tax=Klebsiella pneumoniae TaxID=573 RepID=UPI0021D0A948